MAPSQLTAADQLHQQSTIVDLHAHPTLKVGLMGRALRQWLPLSKRFNPLGMRTSWQHLREGNVSVVLSAAYAPEREIAQECKAIKLLRWLMPLRWKTLYEGNYFDVTVRFLDEVERAAADSPTEHPITIARGPDDLPAPGAPPPDGTVLVHCIEGAHSLDGDPDNAAKFAERGVAYITLAHFYPHDVFPPCNPWEENVRKAGCFGWYRDPSLPLGPKGHEIIEAIVAAGMLIDVVHSTPVARKQIYDIVADKPLIASHVGAYAINPSPYNLRDWELKRIADSGGVIGVIFMNYWLMPREKGMGLDAISHTIRHMVDVAGTDHVALGTDFDGFTDPPDDIIHAGQMLRVTQRLEADGYSSEEIQKILGGNVLRVLRDGWTPVS